MARREALPGGALDKLMEEAKAPRREPKAAPAKARRASPRRSREDGAIRARIVEAEAIDRYAEARGLVSAPLKPVRLALQLAMDVRDAAKKTRISVARVVANALAGWLLENEA